MTAKRWASSDQLASMSSDELVTIYAEAAAACGKLVPTKAQNAAADCVARAYRQLRTRGRDAQLLLLPLMSDTRPGVRGWSSAHALEFEPGPAERRLIEISRTDPFPHGFNAEMVLKEWRAGRLRFP